MSEQEYDTTHRNEVRWIRVSEMIFDPSYNRTPNKERVAKIVKDFNPEYLGTLTLSARGDHVFAVVDGQHRVLALRDLGWDDREVRTHTYYDLEIKDEARLHGGLNTLAKPTARDSFRAREVSGDETAVAISQMLTEFGMTSAPSGAKAFPAIASAEKIYNGKLVRSPGIYPEILHNTLHVLTESFGVSATSVQSPLLEGISLLFFRYGDKIEQATLIHKLTGYPGGALGLLGGGRAWRAMRGGPLGDSIAEVVHGVYNRNRRSKALPPWRI